MILIRLALALLLVLSVSVLAGCLPSPGSTKSDSAADADGSTPDSIGGADGTTNDSPISADTLADGSPLDQLGADAASPTDARLDTSNEDLLLDDGLDVAPNDIQPSDSVGPSDVQPSDSVDPQDVIPPSDAEPGTCGGIKCPTLAGYSLSCNSSNHCEYASLASEPWRKREVWIYLPPAENVPIGRPDGELDEQSSTEKPEHLVTFSRGFLIGKYEVTTEIFAACQNTTPDPSCGAVTPCIGKATDPQSGPDHPQTCIGYGDAEAVCNFLGGRLPTEAEWEYAAKGKTYRRYPWGPGDPSCSFTAWYDEGTGAKGCGSGSTATVGTLPGGRSPCGALDMAGNALEWVADCRHDSYDGVPSDGHTAWTTGCTGSDWVARGGGFRDATLQLRTTARFFNIKTPGSSTIEPLGVRCVRELD